jgi:hypothetical protein
MECWRKYFFEYVLGWRYERPSVHLVFGSAWHEAVARMYLSDFSAESVRMAYYDGFLPIYRKTFDSEEDEINSPKTPARAFLALAAYANRRQKDEYEYEVMNHLGTPMIEIGGTVNLSDDRHMAFRMDTILKGPHGIISREHKTSSSTWNWDLQWYLSSQIGMYSHVLYCLYPETEVRGVVVEGTFFKKTKDDPKKDREDPFRHFEFMSVPVYRSPSNMNWWLNMMLYWLDMVEWNFDILSESSDRDSIMKAFPPNSRSCSNWKGCPYHDLCMSWANPLRHCDNPPIGFKVDFWNPLEAPSRVKLEV